MQTLKVLKNAEGLEIIAEFMGFTLYPAGTIDGINHDSWNVKSDVKVYLENWDRLKFDTSPDWLNPAYEKFYDYVLKMKVGYRYLQASDKRREIYSLITEGKILEACNELIYILKWLKETEGMFNSDSDTCSSCGSPARNCIC